jgi:hypothetical protein
LRPSKGGPVRAAISNIQLVGFGQTGGCFFAFIGIDL